MIIIIISMSNIMALRAVEFCRGDTKLERFLSRNKDTQKKLLNFENWELVEWGGVKRCQKLTFKIQSFSLGKNLSNFESPNWKLDNPYCHILHDPKPDQKEAKQRNEVWQYLWFKSWVSTDVISKEVEEQVCRYY